jgi:hypothetical protein
VTVVALFAAAPARAQSDALYTRLNILSGFEARSFSFDSGLSVRRASQWHVPLAFVVPAGRRVSLDLSASYVNSSLTTIAGTTQTITGLTDTQLRLLYTVRRDRLATSLLFNLPTGRHSVSTTEFSVTGAVGSNFLSFPVSALGTAFGVTGGVAYAARAGAWNVGLAGSVRYLGPYEPLSDQAATYTPGLETRLRAGFDRLLGPRTRMLLGLTGSTFSTDELSGMSAGTAVTSTYRPGTRFIGDFALLHVVGRTTLTLVAWDYYRLAGRSGDSTAASTRENVFNIEARARIAVAPQVQLEPMAAFRQHNPDTYRGGRLYATGLAAHWSFSDRFSAQLAGRFDWGWVLADDGFATLTGTGATLLLRYRR